MRLKKGICLLTAAFMLFSFTGCDNENLTSDNSGITGIIRDKNGNIISEGTNTPESTEVKNFSSDINVDILSRHLLPSFERMKEEDRVEFVESLQVYKKIGELGIDKNDFLYPERNLANLRDSLNEIIRYVPDDMETVDFSGATSEELQSFINENIGKAINIKSEEIEIRSQVNIPSDTYIIGNNVNFKAYDCGYVIVAENVKNVVLDSVCINGSADYGVFVANSENVTVSRCEITGLKQKAICVTANSSLFCIEKNEISKNGAGGIYCAGNVSKGIIQDNTVSENFGTSNWMAGIVLSNAATSDPLDIWENFDVNHRCPARDNLYLQINSAHEIIVENNEVSKNNSSGIYSDGSFSCYIINNYIHDNDKEGTCLDNGTLGTYLKENLIANNGGRYRQTDDDLMMDYVLDAGRNEDGSAKSKLPGVSLDNTAYNIIENNAVINNYGGGIKMVRSTIRCLITENIVKDNNKGQNDLFHFFGIELGAAIPDEHVSDMDFTSDFENIVCRNIISGDHYSGVFIGEDCYVNDIFDNVIMEPQMFAIECISIKFNSMINNFSNAGVRNEYKG